MKHITQHDLLTEGFWNDFPKVRQGIEAVKQISSVVAPEIHDPIKKTWDKAHEMKTKIKAAGKNVTTLVVEALIYHGYYPYDPKNGITWARDKMGKIKKNNDGTYTGIVKVGALGYDKDGQPEIEAEYTNPLKRNVTFTYNNKTREIKILSHPFKNLTVKDPQDQKGGKDDPRHPNNIPLTK